ncbi:MAG: protein TolQ, partial [Bdellovibrionia bacterium]
ETGLFAKLVLLSLLLSSIVCWSIVFAKWKTIRLARLQNEKFISIFWNSKNVEEIMHKSEKFSKSPVAMVFQAGVKELRRFNQTDSSMSGGFEKVENVQRALLRSSNEQVSRLENQLGWLATTASAAPFVGLFGTVWGIMNAFHSIGQTGAANLAVVAPGIAEALITTATGIGAAIPAVIAYNFFSGEIKKIALEIESFAQDFVNIIQRTSISTKKGNQG